MSRRRDKCSICGRPKGMHAAHCHRLDEPEPDPKRAFRDPHKEYFDEMCRRQKAQEAEYERKLACQSNR